MPFISGDKIKYTKKEVYQDLITNGVDASLAYSKVYNVSIEDANKKVKENRFNELRKMGISFQTAYIIAYGKDNTEIAKSR